MRVWLITGGMSAEREVALDSGRAVSSTLQAAGHPVYAYDLARGDFLPEFSGPGLTLPAVAPDPVGSPAVGGPPGKPSGAWAARLLAHAAALKEVAEVAFLALHGQQGENGAVQTLLETAGFPYTGAGPLASGVAMDKALSKRLMAALEVPTPPWTLIDASPEGPCGDPERAAEELERIEASEPGALPLVVKPVAEGSSVGVTIVRASEEWPEALCRAAEAARRSPGMGAQVLVEKYIPGRELTVGFLGDRPLPVVEIIPEGGFYDYERKYTAGASTYRVPAEIPAATAERLRDDACRLYAAIGCRGMGRVDFRVDPEGAAYCLELNTIPGLTETSLLPKAAGAIGVDFLGLIEAVCRAALETHGAPAAQRSLS